jgi:NAD(P)-dependent dehydrogenase (short-subunit alcohol dehydrogenase family)
MEPKDILKKTSRRQVLSGLSIGFVAAQTAPVFAQQSSTPDTSAPMGRPGQPAELAPIYVLLASQESSYATGQVYGAAGGSGNP